MTATLEPEARSAPPAADDPTGSRWLRRAGRVPAPSPTTPVTDHQASAHNRPLGVVAATWVAVTIVGVLAVLVLVGSFTEQRAQARLIDRYRERIESATNAGFGLPGVEAVTAAPARGEPVAIIDIEAIGLRRVVVEGSGPRETERGPGHVVGTAAPGQPGNAVVVGRRQLLGASFAKLDQLEAGDEIVVTTEQGQTVYEVEDVGRQPVGGVDAAAEVYGPSDDDRLTLVTSATASPLNSAEALVVVAELDGTPFEPTPQGGRTSGDDGRSGDPIVGAGIVLAIAAQVFAVVAAVWLFRSASWRPAYLLAIPLLVAGTILLAEQVARTLPAWA